MTINTENIRSDYVGNGVATSFPYNFKLFSNSSLRALVDGVEKAYGSDYTLTGVGEDTFGNVNFTTPPSNGATITFLGSEAVTQNTDLVNETAFFQDRIEQQLDRQCRVMQIQGERIGRQLTLPEDEAGSELLTTLPSLSDRKGRTLSFDSTTGQPVVVSTASTAISTAMEPVVQAATLALARAAMGPWGDALVTATGSTTARTLAARAADRIDVKDYGAVGDGATDDTVAIKAAIAAGGGKTVWLPAGTYLATDRLLITVDRTVLSLDAGATLICSGWSYPGSQTPFGNAIHITANYCAVVGRAPSSSVIQLAGGSQANAIGILHKSGLLVRGLTIDGAKSTASAVADDTFMSGVSIVVTSSGGATEDARVTVDNCVIRNFLQYGVNIYGNKAGGCKITGCTIVDNGKVGDALSVGAGIVATRAINDLVVANNTLTGNKSHGFFGSSAGEASSRWVVANNVIRNNTRSGISITEESAYASVAGVGVSGITIVGNTVHGNGEQGIKVGTYDNVGQIDHVAISGNTVTGNTQYGIIVQSNAAANRVGNLLAVGNTTSGNTSGGIFVSSNVNVSSVSGNIDNGTPFYQQGTFTPTISGTSTAGVGTYNAQSGAYTRIGNLVHFSVVIDWSAHTGTGNLRLSGLPFTAVAGEPQHVAWAWANGLTITGQAVATVISGQAYADMGAINNGSYAAVAMDTAATLRVSGTYRI